MGGREAGREEGGGREGSEEGGREAGRKEGCSAKTVSSPCSLSHLPFIPPSRCSPPPPFATSFSALLSLPPFNGSIFPQKIEELREGGRETQLADGGTITLNALEKLVFEEAERNTKY